MNPAEVRRLRERLAAGRDERAGAWKTPVPWKPPEPQDFAPLGQILAFDPSLSATGWVRIVINAGLRAGSHEIIVLSHGTLRIANPPDIRGYRRTYDKAGRMKGAISEVIWRERSFLALPHIVWEAPPVRGYRTESSLIAGFLVYDACGGPGTGTAIPANHASKLLTGSPHHAKAEIRAAVARYVPEAAQAAKWSEHECDALAIGLTFALDMPAAEEDEEDDIN